jgi:hypothetical protein
VRAATPQEPALPEIEAVLAPRLTPHPGAETLIRRALKAVGLLKR